MNGQAISQNTRNPGHAGRGTPGPLTRRTLVQENRRHADTGGVSRNNADLGFRPAFYDTRTDTAYLSRFRDGRPAPFHLIEGLPADLFAPESTPEAVAALRPGVIAGFVLAGRFYTRDQAAGVVRKASRH